MYLNLETERLRLRPVNIKDAEFILELVNTKGWLKFIGDRNVSDKKDAEDYIQKILDRPNFYYTVFELKTTHKAMGIVTFLKREDEKFPDIGFALLPQFEKNGFTLEASKAYLEKVMELNKYEHIIAITKPDNKKSINLIIKLGLQHTGDSIKGDEILSCYSIKTKMEGS